MSTPKPQRGATDWTVVGIMAAWAVVCLAMALVAIFVGAG